jgi:hypothetical protein
MDSLIVAMFHVGTRLLHLPWSDDDADWQNTRD